MILAGLGVRLMESDITTSTVLAVLGAFAAVAQAFAAIIMVRGLRHSARSADAATRAIELSEANSRRQLRAYIDAVKSEFTGFIPGKPIRLELRIKNFGQTPARDMKVTLASGIVSLADISGIFERAQDMTPIALAAGAETVIFSGMAHETWAAHRQALEQGDVTYVATLSISYRDVFDDRHTWSVTIHVADGMAHASGGAVQVVSKSSG